MGFYNGIFLAVVLAAVATTSDARFDGNSTVGLGIFGSATDLLSRAKTASTGFKSDLVELAMNVAKGLRDLVTYKQLTIRNNIKEALSNLRIAKRRIFSSPETRADSSSPLSAVLSGIFDGVGSDKWSNLFPRDFETRGLSVSEEDDETDAAATAATTAATTSHDVVKNSQRDNLYVPINPLAYENQRSARTIDSTDSTFQAITADAPVTPKLARSSITPPTSDTPSPTTSWGIAR